MRLEQRDTVSGCERGRMRPEAQRGLLERSGKKVSEKSGGDAGAGAGGFGALLKGGRRRRGGARRCGGRRGAVGRRAGAFGAAAAIRIGGGIQLERPGGRRERAGQGENEREEAAEHYAADGRKDRARCKREVAGVEEVGRKEAQKAQEKGDERRPS